MLAMPHALTTEASTFIESLRAFCLIVQIERATSVDALYAALAFTMSRKRFEQVLRAVIATSLVQRQGEDLLWIGGAQ
jgi:hypothetical protein